MSSANMSQATEIFVTCNGRSLIKILNRIGPRTDPCGIPNFTEPSENMSHGGKHFAFCLQDTI